MFCIYKKETFRVKSPFTIGGDELGDLAIIPARSGSKGLPDKNIKPLCGKPLIAYSIEAALMSGRFDTIHVSTDSMRYAEISAAYGADIPFLRSEEASSDQATSDSMIREVLNGYQKRGKQFDTLCLLQPTSPLRLSTDVDHAYELYRQKQAAAVVAVCKAEHSPLWCNTLPENLSLQDFLHRDTNGQPRQMLSQFYRINGAIYVAQVEKYLETGSFYGPDSYAYLMPKERSVDIDDLVDFLLAEAILKAGMGK